MGNSNTNERKEIDYDTLVSELKNEKVYIMYGFGDKSMFADLDALRNRIKKIAEKCSNSVFLYFGDVVNENKPDIGYAYQLLQEYNPTIRLYMIQISIAKNWGVSNKLNISRIFWHDGHLDKYTDNEGKELCVYGGYNQNTDQPCSNTKIWTKLIKSGIKIRKAFILGGGPITAKEIRLMIALKVSICFYPFRRKFIGDGKTLVPDKPTKEEAYGDTYIYVFNGINDV